MGVTIIIMLPLGVSPVTYSGLSVGEHEVKVRPNGPLCERRIRRTVDFTVV